MLRTPDIRHKYKGVFLPPHFQNISALSAKRKFRLRSHTRVGTVSYTHLDVYKRQELDIIDGLKLRGVAASTFNLTDNPTPVNTMTFYQAGSDTPVTVSYTHLDVYKRQTPIKTSPDASVTVPAIPNFCCCAANAAFRVRII